MDDKEKNAEVAKAIKLPDLASYMQVVIKQLYLEALNNQNYSETTKHKPLIISIF